jgi:hypothetical protein
MKSNRIEIYIELLDEGTDTWRPAMAEDLGNGLYKVLPTPDYDPEVETWEFLPGAIVRLKEMTLGFHYDRKLCLVAIAP